MLQSIVLLHLSLGYSVFSGRELVEFMVLILIRSLPGHHTTNKWFCLLQDVLIAENVLTLKHGIGPMVSEVLT